MYYIVYKTTNTINGKYYIGKHQTENLDDGYIGSGTKLKLAIEKYGYENFTREILFMFDNWEDMNAKEAELVNEDLVNDRMCYNVGLGGQGGPMFKGRKHSAKTKAKISQNHKDNPYHHTEESKKKMSVWQKGKHLSDEHRRHLSEAGRRYNESLGKPKRLDEYDPTKPIKRIIDKPVCNVDKTQKRIHIHKNDESRVIYKEELDYYLKDDWKLGRPEYAIKKYLGSRGKFKWMHKDDLDKCVNEKDFIQYLNDGWIFGRSDSAIKKAVNASKDKKYHWIYNEQTGERKFVQEKDMQQYLNNGWKRNIK